MTRRAHCSSRGSYRMPAQAVFQCSACGWRSGLVPIVVNHRGDWRPDGLSVTEARRGVECPRCRDTERMPCREVNNDWMMSGWGTPDWMAQRRDDYPRGFWTSSPSEAVFFDDLYGRRIAPKPRCP